MGESLTIKLNGQTYEAKGDISLSPLGEDADSGSTPDKKADPEVGIVDMGGLNDLHPHSVVMRVGDSVVFSNVTEGQQVYLSGKQGIVGGFKAWTRDVKAVGVGTVTVFCYSKDGTRELKIKVLPAKDGFSPKQYTHDGNVSENPNEPGTDESAESNTPAADGGNVVVNAVIGDDKRKVSATASPGKRVRCVFEDGSTSPLSIKHYNDGGFVLEARYMDMLGDIFVHSFKATVGDQVFERSNFTVYSACASRPFWYRQLEPQANIPWSKLPSIGGGEKGSYAGHIAKLDESDPSDVVVLHKWMGDYGERADIGVIPDWDALAIADPTDENLETVRVMGDCSGPVIRAYVDPETDELVDPRDHPGITENTQAWAPDPLLSHSTDNPFSRLDTAHATGFNIAAHVIYGTEFDREQMAAWALWCGSIAHNHGYRRHNGAGTISIHRVQDRSVAWIVKTIAAAADTDHWLAPVFTSWVNDIAQQILSWKTLDPEALPFLPYGIRDGRGGSMEDRGAAAWQHHYAVMAFGFAVRRGFDSMIEAAHWMSRIPIEGILPNEFKDDSDPEVPYELATLYHNRTREKARNRSKDNPNYRTWARVVYRTTELYDKVAKAFEAGSGTQELQDVYAESNGNRGEVGQLIGYPTSPYGYPIVLGAALAECYRLGFDNADRAYAKFLSVDAADTSVNPKYRWLPE